MINIPFSSKDILGRYYTDSVVSKILVEQIEVEDVKNIIDLGSGTGSLSSAAAIRWHDAKIFSLDIEINSYNINFLEDNSGRYKHVVSDALRNNLHSILGVEEKSVDVAICNPPYLRPKWNKNFKKIIENTGLEEYYSINKAYPSEILFLAQILKLLKEGGEAGIILPDGIFTSQRFESIRKFLVTELYIKKIIELPRKVFERTDAKTHILFFKNKKIKNEKIELLELQENGNLSDSICISNDQAINRLDYSYYKVNDINREKFKLNKIGDITKIKRGKLSSTQIKNEIMSKLHTTNLKKFQRNLVLNGKKDLLKMEGGNYVIARPGDILIARVGRDCYKKIAKIKSGYAVISDCIFIIRANEILYRNSIYNYFVSDQGQSVLNSISYGVSAMQISMKDLKNVSIELS